MVSLICLMFLFLNEPIPLLPSRDAEIALAAYQQMLQSWSSGQADQAQVALALEEVEAAIFRRANALQDRFTDQTEWRRIAGDIFYEIPQLPPEIKNAGRFTLPRVRFRLKPQHLFVRAIRFKGTRTLRLSSVTLIFQDKTQVTHDQWAKGTADQGQEFPKEQWTPHLPTYRPNQRPQARRLMAIEVVGSAQDKAFKALLDIEFEIPFPKAADASQAMAAIEAQREQLARGPSAIPSLQTNIKTLERLIKDLGNS